MQNVTENSLDLINQGCALMAQQQYEQALEKFLLAQKDSPKYIDCYINLGNVYSCLEKYDDALENFKKALILDEKSSTVLFDIGNIMYLKGDKVEAVKYYNKADECGNLTADMCDVISGLFIDEQDYVQALRYINRAIKLDPMNGEYYLEKAKIFIDQQKATEALETLHELNKLLPDAYEAYDMLSEIYTIKKDYDNAIGIVEKGLTRFPEDVNLAYLKLKVLTNFEKDQDALDYISSMKESGAYYKREIDFALLEADVYLRGKNVEKAIECLECAAKGDYSNQQLGFVLSTIYLKSEQFDKVIYIAEKMLASESELFYAASAKFYLAQAKFFRGDDDAEKVLREITKEFRRITIMNPSFYEGYVYRLLAHKALKEFDEALNLAEYMKNLFPDRPDGYVFKYTIYKDMNDLEKAEQEKREALNIDPSFVF